MKRPLYNSHKDVLKHDEKARPTHEPWDRCTEELSLVEQCTYENKKIHSSMEVNANFLHSTVCISATSQEAGDVSNVYSTQALSFPVT